MNATSPATQAPELLREAATAAKRSSLQRVVIPTSFNFKTTLRRQNPGGGEWAE